MINKNYIGLFYVAIHFIKTYFDATGNDVSSWTCSSECQTLLPSTCITGSDTSFTARSSTTTLAMWTKMHTASGIYTSGNNVTL